MISYLNKNDDMIQPKLFDYDLHKDWKHRLQVNDLASLDHRLQKQSEGQVGLQPSAYQEQFYRS